MNDLNSATLRAACRGFCHQSSARAAVLARHVGLALAGLALFLAGFAPAPGATIPLRITNVTPRSGLVDVNWQGGTGPFQLLCRTNYTTEWRKAGQPTTGFTATVVAPPGAMCFFLVTTDVTPPTVPTNLRVTTNGCGTALVTWNASVESGNPSNAPVSGLKGYRIYRNGAFVRSVSTNTLATVEEGMSSATTYSIGVAAVDLADNESALAVASVTIMACPNQRPLANAGLAQTNLFGSTTYFDGSNSRDLDGRIVSYFWNFGDGANSSEMKPSHRYETAGRFTATLTVTDNLGLTGTDTAMITVNLPPVAHAGPDQTNVVGATVSFDARGSQDSDGTISTCTWQFGDSSGATGTGTVTSHVYTAVGTYSVRLIVRDNAGASAKATALVTINTNMPPVAVPGPNRSGVAKSNISFDGLASWDPDGTISSFCWRFPDGTCISNAIAAYAFTNVGTFSVQLTVIDNAGASDTKSTTVSVAPPTEPLTPGQFLSVTNLGGPSGDVGNAVTIDRYGNTLIGGRMSELPFLAKLSPSNTVLWKLQFGGAGVGVVQGVASSSDGSIFVTGSFYATVDFGGGPLTSAGGHDIFLAKFSANGNHVWSKRFGSAVPGTTIAESGLCIAAGPDDSIVVAGIYDGTVNFGGSDLPSNLVRDVFLAKFTSSGTNIWSRRLGSSSAGPLAKALALDANGNVFVTGNFGSTVDFGGGPVTGVGSLDMFLAKYSAAGAYFWVKRFGIPGTSSSCLVSGSSVVVDNNGDAVVVGEFKAPVSVGGPILSNATPSYQDMFVAKYAGSDGTNRWSKRFGGAYNEFASAVSLDTNGNIVITGKMGAAVDFGGGLLPYVSGVNGYLASFTSSGAHRWSKSFGTYTGDVKAVAVAPSGTLSVTGSFWTLSGFGGPAMSGSSGTIFVLQFAP